jgi:hypothetical protein
MASHRQDAKGAIRRQPNLQRTVGWSRNANNLGRNVQRLDIVEAQDRGQVESRRRGSPAVRQYLGPEAPRRRGVHVLRRGESVVESIQIPVEKFLENNVATHQRRDLLTTQSAGLHLPAQIQKIQWLAHSQVACSRRTFRLSYREEAESVTLVAWLGQSAASRAYQQ